MNDADPDADAGVDATRSANPDREYGETWVYESIVGAVPGVELSDRAAVAVQFLLFEALAAAVALVYDLPAAFVAGTAAIAVAALGSAVMLSLGRRTREFDTPAAYRHLLFGSKIELVLGLVAFVIAVVYLFVYDPRTGGATLVAQLLGERPPLLAAFLMLLVLWDLCYRIGLGWWASVVGLWLAVCHRASLSPAARTGLVRLNAVVVGYAAVQLSLVPFVTGHPVLLFALVGHVLAVGVVAGLSAALFRGTMARWSPPASG